MTFWISKAKWPGNRIHMNTQALLEPEICSTPSKHYIHLGHRMQVYYCFWVPVLHAELKNFPVLFTFLDTLFCMWQLSYIRIVKWIQCSFLISDIQKILALQLVCEQIKIIIMTDSHPKNKVARSQYKDVICTNFKLSFFLFEVIITYRAVLLPVYTQGHYLPRADFEDILSLISAREQEGRRTRARACVCVFIPIGWLNFCFYLLLLTHFHLHLAVLNSER